MSFAEHDLARIAAAEEVEIETQAPGGHIHRTIIWVVVDDGDTFLRSVRGANGRWYREALANPAVAIHVDGRRLTATVIPATDPDSIERTSDALRKKYAADPALHTMLEPDVLGANVRLEPA